MSQLPSAANISADQFVADYVSYTLWHLYALDSVFVFRPMNDSQSLVFSCLGSFSRADTGKGLSPLHNDLPKAVQNFWLAREEVATYYHRPDQEETIAEICDVLEVPGTNQFGLLKTAWCGRDGTDHLVVAGVREALDHSEPKTFFDTTNLVSMREVVEFITAPPGGLTYQFDFFFRLRSLKLARVGGSRKALEEAARTVLEHCAFEDHPNGLAGQGRSWLLSEHDYVTSTFVDMRTGQEILPGPESRNETLHETEGHQTALYDLKETAFPFTDLARLRRDSWRKSKAFLPLVTESQEVEGIFDNFVHAHPAESALVRSLAAPPAAATLPEALASKLVDFAVYHRLGLEQLRTCFFYLHHAAASRRPLWGRTKGSGGSPNLAIIDGDSSEALCKQTLRHLGAYLADWKTEGGDFLITSDWLAGWFGLKLLQEDLLGKSMRSQAYSPNEIARFYEYLSCYYLHLIHWMKNGGDPTLFIFSDVEEANRLVLESKLFLISEYAHSRLGLSRRVPLFESLRQMWQSEAALYTIHEAYRQHLHHSVDVCLLGLLLIESGLLTRIIGRDLEDEEITEDKRQWVIAALLHDVGYGLRLSEDVLERLEFLDQSPLLSKYLGGLKETFDKQKSDLLAEEDSRLLLGRNIEKLSHGSVSALYMAGLVKDYTTDKHDRAWVNEIRPALKATVGHDRPEIPVDAREDRLSFLLLICDHLQEWGRPRAEEGFRHQLAAQLMLDTGWRPVGASIMKYLQVNLIVSEEKSWQWKLPENDLTLHLYFRNAERLQFEPAALWVTNSVDFQKVDKDTVSTNIRMIFHHPMPVDRSQSTYSATITEMDLFQDFVRESLGTPALSAAFSDWLSMIRERRSDCWLDYRFDDRLEEEIFSVNFGPDFRREPERPIPFEHEGLYRAFSEWKQNRLDIVRPRRQS